MHYRRLGRTDLQVSVICLGTMTWGQQNTEAEAHEQLDHALGRGVNFIDAAEMYPVPALRETHGRTEEIIGNWLQRRARRDDVVLATKIVGPAARFDWLRDGPRLNARNINQAIDDSLRRLKTDYVDLYQLHWPDRNANFFSKLGYVHDPDESVTPIEETLAALDGLVKAGKIRHAGLSNETPWGAMRFLQLSEKHNWPRIVSVQNPYGLLNRTYEAGMAEVSVREECGLLAYSPLGGGVLSGKYLDGARPEGTRVTRWPQYFGRYLNESGQEATRKYVELARTHGLDPATMANAFVNRQPFVTANIIGATSMTQLEANIASVDLELSGEILDACEKIHERHTYPCP